MKNKFLNISHLLQSPVSRLSICFWMLLMSFLSAPNIIAEMVVSIPYETDFEAGEGYAIDNPLSGDWLSTDSSIVVTDEVAYSGTQSVQITSAAPENIISLRFDPSGNSILFLDYYMQFTASVLPELPAFTSPKTTAILAVQPYLSDSGEWMFLDGDGTGSGDWLNAGDLMALDSSSRTDWHRITLRFNLSQNTWDAYIDGNLHAIDLGFVEAMSVGSEAINIYGNSTGLAYIDKFSLTATNPLFADADLDGIDDDYETEHGLDSNIDDRFSDLDADGLTNVEEYIYGTDPSVFTPDGGFLSEIFYNRTEWYIDPVNGDDVAGTGSASSPLQSLGSFLEINASYPDYVGAGDTLYLASGDYSSESITIAIPGLSLIGTLDASGESLTQMGDLEITADTVTLKQLSFHNSGLVLKNVAGVLVSNNRFTGDSDISLSLQGASDNIISHNHFSSGIYHSVMISWDAATAHTSNDNTFIQNYFTHRLSSKTNESIYVTYTPNNDSLNARNQFIGCAFEETVSGLMSHVITDEGTWWMTDTENQPYQYSVRFEDCYFKRADQATAFSEFAVTADWPDLGWQWDGLANDDWVSKNDTYALTGNYKGWGHAPRIQFVDGNGNGAIVETVHTAGLLPPSNTTPFVENAGIPDVDAVQDADDVIIDLYYYFGDAETVDSNLNFSIELSNPALLSYSLTGGNLRLSFAAGMSGTSLVTVTASDDDVSNPLSVNRTFTTSVYAQLQNRTEWYIDSVNGDDVAGTGSASSPLRSLSDFFEINASYPDYVGAGDTLYLASGDYSSESITIAIPGLSLIGTLDASGESLTQMGDLEITADTVTLKQLSFHNSGLVLKNVAGVLVSNNRFTGDSDISLSLQGASDNIISHNHFSSGIYHSVMISWDAATAHTSNDNTFIQNYFTHRLSSKTNESIYVTYTPNNDSLNARNQFIGCAFEETVSGLMSHVITDEGTWWMTDTENQPYQYSVRFEDCYFKRADQATAFSEFAVTADWPDLGWQWDGLANDDWVSKNDTYALTGNYKGWGHAPRIQFVDGNGNGAIVETDHTAGLLPVNTDADTDADGVSDEWEQQIIDADVNDSIATVADVLPSADFDGDGITNANEYAQGRIPTVPDADVTLYVDSILGDDGVYTGLSAAPGKPTAADGPKSSITGAFGAASNLDVVLLQSGTYGATTLNLNGANLTLRINGDVTIR